MLLSEIEKYDRALSSFSETSLYLYGKLSSSYVATGHTISPLCFYNKYCVLIFVSIDDTHSKLILNIHLKNESC